MGPLGGFWPKLGWKRVTGWKQRSCVPPGRVKTNKCLKTAFIQEIPTFEMCHSRLYDHRKKVHSQSSQESSRIGY
jgi:hypothetical protein